MTSEGLSVSDDLDDHMPHHLLCPISHHVLEVPVLTPSGHTYDRASMLRWLAHCPVDPLSRLPLAASSLYFNRSLQAALIAHLDKLASQAADAGRSQLADTARRKIERIRTSPATVKLSGRTGRDRRSISTAMNRCSCLSVRLGVFAWEQIMVWMLSACAVVSLKQILGTKKKALGMAFLRLLWLPTTAATVTSWSWLSRFALCMLRATLYVPLGLASITCMCGIFLAVIHFLGQCFKMCLAESEHAVRNQRFVRIVHSLNAIVGITSLYVFMLVYRDSVSSQRTRHRS